MAYWSQSRIGGGPAAMAGMIRSLLAVSGCNNHRLGVTGVLLFSQNHFAQVLEGSRAGVAFVFGRIPRDARQGCVVLARQGFVPARAFGPWPMIFVRAATLPDL